MEIDKKMQTIIDKVREWHPYLRMCQTAVHYGIHDNPDFCRLELSIKNGRAKSRNLLTQWDSGFISFETFMQLCGVSLEPDANIAKKKHLLIEKMCDHKHEILQSANADMERMFRAFWEKAPFSLLQKEAYELNNG